MNTATIDEEASVSSTSTAESNEQPLSPTNVARLVRSVSYAARESSRNIDPFDIDDPHWTLERTLRAAIERTNQEGLGTLSPRVSLAWSNVAVFGNDAARVEQSDALALFTQLIPTIRQLWTKAPEKTILHGMDGLLLPGEMLLVLGPPSSGCTSLLKMLSGSTEGFRRWSGSINYSGIPLNVMQERFSSMLAFNNASDNHFPYLTVAQTLEFAASTKTPHRRMNGITRKQFSETTRDILLATFGLKHTANTRVGNDFVRGVSGGERRRVSIAEMLLTRACVSCWDNPTRGLDSSTSLDFARALRVATNLTDNVSVSALYQPGDALAEVYDKVTLLHDGRQIFFGSLAEARDYFIDMGFECLPRQTVAEFLVSVTDAKARVIRSGFDNRVPRSAQDFEEQWKASGIYRQLQHDIVAHSKAMETNSSMELHRFKNTRSTEKAPLTRPRSPYSLNLSMQFTTTFHRAIQRIRGEYAYFLAITTTMLVIPMVIGSMFYDIDPGTSGFFSKGGVIFFMVLFNILVNFAEIVAQFSQRPIVEKHHSYSMYHPFVDALANMVSQYPIKVFNILAFTIIVYFMAGLKRDVGAFFLFVLFTYLITLTMTAWFRIVAALANTIDMALVVSGLSLLPLAMYAGYIIPRPSMHPWFEWISYLNPIYYSIEALMAIEFHGRNAQCHLRIPSGPGYEDVDIANQVCPVVGAKPGDSFVLGDDYIGLSLDYHYSHVWRNLGISIAFFIVFTIIYATATEYKKLQSATGTVNVFRKGAAPTSPSKATDIETGPYSVTDDAAPNTTSGVSPNLQASTDVFSWKNINYDVKIKGETRRLLSDVQGFVEPGTLTALMGASGAGKTTLLNVLALRQGNIGVVSGDMKINGVALDEAFKRRTGYVQQQDVHLSEMTVREAFRFSALLRQPQETPKSEKLAYVEKIISLLELGEYAEAVIGRPGQGLTIEKRKRTTIGIELVARPSLLLFVDEPTSGLDSQSAWSIVKLLRDLADAGQAILCTIHQPSSTLLAQFDRLLLLAKGGKTVYFGDLGPNSQLVIDYFTQYGAQNCPENANPAEYILEQIGAGATGKASLDWPSIWATSTEIQEVANQIARFESKEKEATAKDTSSTKTFATTWVHQYLTVQKRLFAQHWRSPTYINGKLFINVIGGLFLAFTFYKESDTIQGLQNKTFSVFMVLLLCLVLIVLLQPRLIALREVYDVRERYSNMYHWSVFVVANIVVEIPFNLVISTLCFICWYFPVGWWRSISDGRGAFMWLVFLLYQLYHTTFSQAIAVVSPNAETAAMITILFYTFILAFSGVLQPLQQLVKFWHFAYYVSPFTWLVSALMSAGEHGVPVKCAQAEINIFQPPKGMSCGEYAGAFAEGTGAAIYNPEASSDCQFCQFAVADTYLAGVNMEYDDRWRNVGLLMAYIVFNVCAFTVGFYLHSGPGLKGLMPKRKRS